jgi:beta-D-xylosidase 4
MRCLWFAFLVWDGIRYDPVKQQPFTKIKMSEMGSVEHHTLALQAARQSTVLLVNRGSTLPIQRHEGMKIAVIGPQGNSTGQIAGNYVGNECSDGTEIWPNNGDMSGGGGQDSWWPCVPTVAQALGTVGGARTTVHYSQGCEQRCSGTHDGTKNVSTRDSLLSPSVCNAGDLEQIDEAVAVAMTSELVVLALGFDTAVAGEGHDRLDIGLPGAQEQLALAVLDAVAKRKSRPKTVLLLLAGNSVSIDGLLNHTALDVVIAGHQPGLTGGTAAAELIFGQQNDLGKLSYTVYPRTYQSEVSHSPTARMLLLCRSLSVSEAKFLVCVDFNCRHVVQKLSWTDAPILHWTPTVQLRPR